MTTNPNPTSNPHGALDGNADRLGKHGDRHPEAFCLMLYGCDDKGKGCGAREILWNTRDGVTPFMIGCRVCPEMMSHLPPWSRDERTRDRSPVYGDRIIVDLTDSRREVLALRSFEKLWKNTTAKAGLFPGTSDKDEAREAYLAMQGVGTVDDGYGLAATDGTPIDTRKGEPDILTVGMDVAWLGCIPEGATVAEVGAILAPQLDELTAKRDLEAIATALEEEQALVAGTIAAPLEGTSVDLPELLLRRNPRDVTLAKLNRNLEEMVAAARTKAEADDLRKLGENMGKLAAKRQGAVSLLKCAADYKGSAYVLTRYGADGKVDSVHEAADTDEGRMSLATVMLSSITEAHANAAFEDAERMRSGELPPSLLGAMRTMKRGELRPLGDGRALRKIADGHCDPAFYDGTLKPVELTPMEQIDDVMNNGPRPMKSYLDPALYGDMTFKPRDLEGVGDHGRFYEVEMGDEVKATDALEAGVTDGERAEIEQDIVDWPPKARRKVGEMLDKLADGMTAKLETGDAVRAGEPGDQVSGVLKASRTCACCGCTDDHACDDDGTPCSWMTAFGQPDLCSACYRAKIVDGSIPVSDIPAKDLILLRSDEVRAELSARALDGRLEKELTQAIIEAHAAEPPKQVTIPFKIIDDLVPQEPMSEEDKAGAAEWARMRAALNRAGSEAEQFARWLGKGEDAVYLDEEKAIELLGEFRAESHQPPAIIDIPIRMPRDATPEELEAQEGPGGCTHAMARVDANLINIEDAGRRVLDVTVRCEDCRHRFNFVGFPVAIDLTRPCVNLRGDIVTLPVVLGELDGIKMCERCNKDHTEVGLVCLACSAELGALNAKKRRVTCRACGHSASYRASELDPKKCKRCRSKQIDLADEEPEEFVMDCFRAPLTTHVLAEALRESGARVHDDESDRGQFPDGHVVLLNAQGVRVGRIQNFPSTDLPGLLLPEYQSSDLLCPHVGDQVGEAECEDDRPCFSRSSRKLREGDDLGHVEAAAALVAPNLSGPETKGELLESQSDGELAALLAHVGRRKAPDPELLAAVKAELERRSLPATMGLTDFPEDLDDADLSDAVDRAEREKGIK